MCAGEHEGVQGDAADVLLHLRHPDGLGLDAVHGQDAALPDVGDPVVVEAHGAGGRGEHQVVEAGDVTELLRGQEVLAWVQGRHADKGLCDPG